MELPEHAEGLGPRGTAQFGVRLVRYCARGPLALERLHAPEGSASLASPDPRLLYRHRGILAPHARLRPVVVGLGRPKSEEVGLAEAFELPTGMIRRRTSSMARDAARAFPHRPFRALLELATEAWMPSFDGTSVSVGLR